jgi:putative phosphoesterase
MRLGVFGDVHGNVAALAAVLAELRRLGAERLLCTGDLVNYGPEPVAALRDSLAATSACVAGNHDRLATTWDGGALPARPGRDMASEEVCLRWTAARLGEAERAVLASLPDSLLWPEEAPRVLLCHGSPLDPGEYVRPDLPRARWDRLSRACRDQGVAVALLGHTHLPMLQVWDGVRFCNPGSVGWPKDGDPRASCGILDLDPGPEAPGGGAVRFSVHRVAYDAAAVAAAMAAAGLPEAVAEAVRCGGPAPG